MQNNGRIPINHPINHLIVLFGDNSGGVGPTAMSQNGVSFLANMVHHDQTCLPGMKHHYFAHVARSHASAFRLHWKEGETLGRGPDIWRNVSEHCLVEGVAVDTLAELVHLPDSDRNNVVMAALLHDWNKKEEVMQQRGPNYSLKAYEEHRDADTRTLRAAGVPEGVIELTDHIPAKDRSGPQTLPQKVFWYVDMIMSNTELVPLLERFDRLERGWDGTKYDPARGARNLRYSAMFSDRYGGATDYETVRELAARIEPELAQLARFEGSPEDLPLFLKKKIEERVRNFKRPISSEKNAL